MVSVFADTDVCIDLLSDREPFNSFAQKLFSLGYSDRIKIYVSSLSFADIDYVLRSQYTGINSRKIIAQFKTNVTVLPVDDKIIALAIASDFNDFDDAIQYYTAIEHRLTIFLTRNIKDYKKAAIKVIAPETFLSRYQSLHSQPIFPTATTII